MAWNLVTPPPLAIIDSQWELEFPRAEHFATIFINGFLSRRKNFRLNYIIKYWRSEMHASWVAARPNIFLLAGN